MPAVVVVGAGISGMYASSLLNAAGFQVTVLEASDRIGGRLYTVSNEKVGYVDLGGAYLTPKMPHLNKLLNTFNISTAPTYFRGDTLVYKENGVERIDASEYKEPCEFDFEYDRVTSILSGLSKQLELARPWASPAAKPLDEMSLQQWMDKTTTNKEVKQYLTMICRAEFCAEPEEVSLLWAIWDMMTVGCEDNLSLKDHAALEGTIKGGAQQLPLSLAKTLPAGSVHLSEPVCSIDQTSPGNVLVKTHSGRTYQADYVILAMPPMAQHRIMFTPSLPSPRNQFLQRMPMGCVIKTFLYYETAHWRHKNLSGTMYNVCGNDEMPVVMAYDYTKEDGSYPSIIGFINANLARKFSALTKEERMTAVANQYAYIFGIPQMAQPLHYEEMDWSSHQWIGGGYAGFTTPKILTTYGSILRKPVDRVHFAGTEIAEAYPGYMEGGLNSAHRAASEILERVNEKKSTKLQAILTSMEDTNYMKMLLKSKI